MQIHLTQNECKDLVAEELSRRMGKTLTANDLRITYAPLDVAVKPDVMIFDLLKLVVTYPEHLTRNKIACMKSLRERAAAMNVNIPLVQAKFFVESIPENAQVIDPRRQAD